MIVQKNISLRDKNTYQIGGNAAFYYEPHFHEDVIDAVLWAGEKKIPILIIGKGSNLLISDSGWPGIVINVSSAFNEIHWDDNRAVAQGGAMLNMLVNQAIERSFAGIEELAGIPGTVGGAVVMNAGAYSMCIENTVEWVRYFDLIDKKVMVRQKNELDYGYRASYLQKRQLVVLEASFLFEKRSSKEELLLTRKRLQMLRREKQPLELPNCGSVFKRPQNNFAGTLIEKCGLKGMRIGDAEVSVKHANFIVNRGNSSAEDVRNLIIHIQKNVYEQTGVLLEPEVIFIGEFQHNLFKPE